MPDALTLIFYVLVFTFGFGFSHLVSRSMIERIGLGWILGSVFSTYLYFLSFVTVGYRFSVGNVTLLLMILSLISIAVYTVTADAKKDFSHLHRWYQMIANLSSISKLSLVCGILLVAIVTHTFIQNLYWPVYDWDSLSLYDFRAKVLVRTGGFEEGVQLGYFYHYPPYTSILHAFDYISGSHKPKVWYSLLYTSLLLIFYSLLRRRSNQTLSVFGTLLLAVSPALYGHSTVAYTNLSYSIFTALGAIYLGLYLRDGDLEDSVKGAFLIAFGTWVRTTEPFWLIGVLLVLIGFVRYPKNVVWAMWSLSIIYFFKQPWNQYSAFIQSTAPTSTLNTLRNVHFDTSVSMFVERATAVLLFLKANVYASHKHYLLPLAISFVTVLKNREFEKLWMFVVYALLSGTIIGGTFLFTYLFEGWTEIPDSATRMSMVLFPVAIYIIMDTKLWTMSYGKDKKN